MLKSVKPGRKANLAKQLQLPTHGKQSFNLTRKQRPNFKRICKKVKDIQKVDFILVFEKYQRQL
jgi:hypothetical protein